jgi:hypothetical protein
VLPTLRRGRYPDKPTGQRVAQVMRAIATEFEA